MGFNVTIRNIGKLEHANIRVGQFTVLAGPNNTGKSTVSKLLYSLFDGMNANHALVYFKNLVHPLETELASLNRWEFPLEENTLPWSFLNTELAKLESQFKLCSFDNLTYIGEQINQFRQSIDVMLNGVFDVQPNVEKLIEKYDSIDPEYGYNYAEELKQSFDSLKGLLNDLRQIIEELSAHDFVIHGLNDRISQNLTDNFQIFTLTPLLAQPDQAGTIEIEGVGKFSWGNGKGIDFSIDWRGMQQLQRYSRVLYLESPMHWKLKPVLEASRLSPRFFNPYGKQRMGGIPAYVFDLFVAMREEYAGNPAFRNLYEGLIASQAINGKIVLAENGELLFLENNRRFPLSMTAMGVINLGILAFLIERGVLDAGTFLFIDEPESHLHPRWQHIMAETLFELSRLGVHVVIATHNLDILKWVEVHLKIHPDDKNLMAMNCFPPCDNSDDPLEVKLTNAKKSLAQPYLNRHIEGI